MHWSLEDEDLLMRERQKLGKSGAVAVWSWCNEVQPMTDDIPRVLHIFIHLRDIIDSYERKKLFKAGYLGHFAEADQFS